VNPSAVAAGLAFGLSLIVVIGAQNAFVLRQGALRQHVTAVVFICAASDVALIIAGVAGMGAALERSHWLEVAVRLAGVSLLLAYAALSARRAMRPLTPSGREDDWRSTRRAVVAACLAFTWLNPAVYLDTVVLLGSVADSHPGSRWAFGTGAMLASVLWFVALGFGARLLAPMLSRPRAIRYLDGFVALVMALTAARILFHA
jgi:L-lysine exporter family protein LysE/ArgO